MSCIAGSHPFHCHRNRSHLSTSLALMKCMKIAQTVVPLTVKQSNHVFQPYSRSWSVQHAFVNYVAVPETSKKPITSCNITDTHGPCGTRSVIHVAVAETFKRPITSCNDTRTRGLFDVRIANQLTRVSSQRRGRKHITCITCISTQFIGTDCHTHPTNVGQHAFT